MRRALSLPGYLLFLSALLKVFLFPATEPTRYGDRPLVDMTALQAIALVALGAAWLYWAVPGLQDSLSMLFRWLRSIAQRRGLQVAAGVGSRTAIRRGTL